MTTHRLHAQISGRVQGVYFRDSTQREAARLALTGWVKNKADGSVEVLAEGPKPQLETLLKFLQVGPTHARVEKVSADWLEATGEFISFEVKW
jgi:acylphosphatase